MSLINLGLTVTRGVPPEVWAGLLSGQYVLKGGVIRWAAGTEYAGRIVKHLIQVGPSPFDMMLPFNPLSLIGDIVNTYQLVGINRKLINLTNITQQVLQVASGTMALSGLNLATSAIGFTVLYKRLNAMEERLHAIEAQVKVIHTILERKSLASLRAALGNVRSAAQISDVTNRRHVLLNTWNDLGPHVEEYAHLLSEAKDLESALVYEEYFLIAAIARARCSADVGELGLAHEELSEAHTTWATHTRRITRDILLGAHPERFLFSDAAQQTSVAALVDWLDFAHDQDKGYEWIDELRHTMPHWHRDESRYVWASLGSSRERERARERDVTIPALHKFATRNRVLEGHVAQAALLAEHNVVPAQFERWVHELAPTHAVDGYLIAEPVEQAG